MQGSHRLFGGSEYAPKAIGQTINRALRIIGGHVFYDRVFLAAGLFQHVCATASRSDQCKSGLADDALERQQESSKSRSLFSGLLKRRACSSR